MRTLMLRGLLSVALLMPVVSYAQSAANTSLGSVTINKKVMADGQPLPPGTYQVRVSSDPVKPVVGQSPDAAKYVEFLRAGKVVGRELATVVPAADVATIMKGEKPNAGGARVEMLKGNDYLRVWINHGGTNYIIHLPV